MGVAHANRPGIQCQLPNSRVKGGMGRHPGLPQGFLNQANGESIEHGLGIMSCIKYTLDPRPNKMACQPPPTIPVPTPFASSGNCSPPVATARDSVAHGLAIGLQLRWSKHHRHSVRTTLHCIIAALKQSPIYSTMHAFGLPSHCHPKPISICIPLMPSASWSPCHQPSPSVQDKAGVLGTSAAASRWGSYPTTNHTSTPSQMP